MTAPQPVAFDPRPLTEPVDPAAVKEFGRRLRAQGGIPSPFASASGVVAIVLVVVVGMVMVMFFSSLIALFAGIGSQRGGGLWAMLPLLILVAVLAVAIVLVVRGLAGSRTRRFRLDRFARANGMSYLPGLPDPQLPGMIFGRGSSRQSSDLVRGEQPRFVEFANYRYTTGSGKNRSTHRWGYVAVKLDVPLPHILLDAAGNNGLFGSNLPATFDRDQRLSLEGDFDEHFALYCPRGYERDALYLFTPDIMARFIDNAAALDVEIVDDWLFLYAKRDLSTLDPSTWAWLFSIVAALLDKLGQWGRWRDERLAASVPLLPDAADTGTGAPGATASGVPGMLPAGQPPLLTPPPGVAAPGRRLKKGVPWAAVIVFGLFAVFWLFMQFDGFSALLGR